jgi:hypothetical protein
MIIYQCSGIQLLLNTVFAAQVLRLASQPAGLNADDAVWVATTIDQALVLLDHGASSQAVKGGAVAPIQALSAASMLRTGA